MESQERSVESEAAQSALLEFAHSAETTGATDRGPASVSLGPFEHGHLETRADDGRVTVTRANDSGGVDLLYDEPLGTLAYVDGDEEIAYQGGGVWRTDGTGTVTVSSPGIEHRDGTLTFPVVHLEGDRAGGRTVDGTVRRAAAPKQIDLDEGTDDRRESVAVRIGIESEYCEAWERELEEKIEGSVTQRCEEGEPQNVQAQLINPPGSTVPLDAAIISETVDIHKNSPPIEGDVRTNSSLDEESVNGTVSNESYDYPSADETVGRALDQCDGRFEEVAEDETGKVTEPGVHCVDEIEDGHVFDTSNGDIDVVVRDSIDPPNGKDLRAEGDNDLTFYVDGNFEARGSSVVGNESEPSQTRFVFSSGSEVMTHSGSPDINALIYAPDSTVDIKGTPAIVGTVIGEEVTVGNINPNEIRHDDSLESIDLIPGAGPSVSYATFTAYEVELED